MATYTENYKLKKPAPEDFADIADLNENMDKIDAALKDKADLDESGKLKESQLPSLSYIPTSQKGAAGASRPLTRIRRSRSRRFPPSAISLPLRKAQREASRVWALTARFPNLSSARSACRLRLSPQFRAAAPSPANAALRP